MPACANRFFLLNMRITVKMGFLFALGWMLVKMILHLTGIGYPSVSLAIFINMFFLLAAICVGLFLHKKQEGFTQGNALSDIKAAMQSAIPYAMLVSLFLYLYYNKINPEFIQKQIADAEMTIDKSLRDPKQLQLIRNEQEAFEVMSVEAIRAELVKGPRGFYSAGATAIIGLLGMTLLGTVYSIFVTIIYRRVLFRNMR